MKWLAGTLAALLLLILLLIPFIASSPVGKPFFIKAFEERISGKVEIGSLHLSWFGPQVFKKVHFTNSDIEGHLEELHSNVPLWSLSRLDGAFTLKNGSFSFPSYDAGTLEEVNGHIQGNDFDLEGKANTSGQFSLTGKVYSKDHFEIAANLTNFPTAALDQLLKGHRLVFLALGPTIDLSGTAALHQNQGSVDATLTSSNIQTTLRANLTEHALTLREPLTATLSLTPEFSQALLSDINPLFLTGIRAKNPILLHLAQCSFPLRPFSLEKLHAAGTLDMGQVLCRNGKSLASLIRFLKAKRLSDAKEMNAWFTPLSVHFENGTLHTGRMDALLADSIHICTWGNIDLIHDRLNIILGLPADTLSQSFGIQNLSENYVLKVPIHGSTQEPELDKGPAAAKIAALLAAQQIPGKKGGLLGGLVKVFTHANDEKDIPPANRPFPWEK
ncbi:MAG TPA: hypothetical protein VLE89_06685 [Chlamydiales bacterium]|nr:hypothetical protein [Chlamydiales bacterium]